MALLHIYHQNGKNTHLPPELILLYYIKILIFYRIVAMEKKENKNPESKENHEQAPEEKIPEEIGGPKGLEPTRYGDWEQKGRCIDF